MPFQRVETIIRSGRAGLPASITLHGGSQSGRPAFIINLSKEFCAQQKIADGARFDLLIGTEEEAGVIRLARREAGLVTAQANGKGGVRLFCGHLERFGSASRQKAYCAAERVDDETNSIEITLPSWALE